MSPKEQTMPNAQQRMDILLRLERGEISPAEAERLLNAANAPAPASTPRMGLLEQVERGELSADEAIEHLLSTPPAAQPPAEEALELAPQPAPRRAGWALLGFGLLLIIASAWWMRSSLLLHGGLSLGFFCLWLPFAAGLGLLGLGVAARKPRGAQLTLRSRKAGQRRDLSRPLPEAVLRGKPATSPPTPPEAKPASAGSGEQHG
jgi:hypothetical protein